MVVSTELAMYAYSFTTNGITVSSRNVIRPTDGPLKVVCSHLYIYGGKYNDLYNNINNIEMWHNIRVCEGFYMVLSKPLTRLY